MRHKLINQGADDVRRVGFYSDGTLSPVSLYIKDNVIQSYQMDCDIIETADTYRGDCPHVREFLQRPHPSTPHAFLVTPDNEYRADMAVELLPLLKDSFDFMKSRSAILHASITDMSNDLLDWAVHGFDPRRSQDIDEIEYILQPFWDRTRVLNIEEVPPIDVNCVGASHIDRNLVIHERLDGHYHIADFIHSGDFEDYLIPNDSVGDVWLVSFTEITRPRRQILDFEVTRIKGKSDD